MLLALQRSAGNTALARLLAGQHNVAAQADGEHYPTQRSTVHEVLRSPGRPLDEPARADMETRLGADFSHVRVHTDAAARDSAAEIGSRAYTSGPHIVIGEGGGDRHTLAHELTHVIQQRHGPVAGTDNGSGLRVSDPTDRFEQHAEANATRVMRTPAQTVPAVELTALTDRTPVQRTIAYHELDPKLDPGHPAEEGIKRFFEAVDEATQRAYSYVLSVPSLGAYVDLDGRTALWYELWGKYLKTGETAGLAAAFGYAVETLVSNTNSKFCVLEILGQGFPYDVLPQVTAGGTRPDLVLAHKNGAQIAWVDITASESAFHIFKKVGWGKNVKSIAEVTYPSLTHGDRDIMEANQGNTGGISKEELDERRKAAQEAYKKRKARWKEIGKTLLVSKLNPEDAEGTKRSATQLVPSFRQGFIARQLMKTFNLTEQPDSSMVPNILQALGVNPKTWDYATGTSASEGAGEAWLMRNAPDVQQSDDSVPMDITP
jgi:hypothetical protein